MSYTRTMEWDPSKIQADKVSAGSLNLGAALTEGQLALLRRATMKGSS